MSHPLRILLLEDDDDDARLLTRALNKGILALELRREETPEGLDAALRDQVIDLVISDHTLGDWTGLEALRRVRAAHPDLPFLLISGQVGEELAVEAMRAGANDFLPKDRLSRLIPVIEREIREAAHRQKHRAAEAERALLFMAIQHAPDYVIITDAQGYIRFANPAVESVSGYSREELLGQSPRLFKSGKQEPGFYRKLWSTLLGGQTWRGHFINRRKDGSLWDAEAAISPVRDEAGEVTAYVCAARDVTHEVELRSQLEQSQRLEAIGILAGGIAHDLNNALMPILVSADTDRLSPEVEPSIRRSFEVITQAGNRARDLVRQILLFSQKGERDPVAVELHLVVREVLTLSRSVLPSSITLEPQVDSHSGAVRGDPTQLHQVVLNLVTNAAHAMRGGNGTLRVELARVELTTERICVAAPPLPPGSYLCLSVSDTGRGMDRETLEKIFLPFYTTKEPGEGTGLGLSIVRGILLDMGGNVQVDSEPGVGTTFRVYLPALRGEGPRLEPQPVRERRRPLRVLLVDDEALLGTLLGTALEVLGYRVEVQTSPVLALGVFASAPEAYDVLLTDLTMPELSGFDLAQAIWRLRPGLPSVLMTGYASEDRSTEAVALGFAAVIEKPCSAQDIAAVLETAVPLDLLLTDPPPSDPFCRGLS